MSEVRILIGPFDTVLLPAGDGWRPVDPTDIWDQGKQCRWIEGRFRCQSPATWALNRGRFNVGEGVVRPSWWHYCDRHLYGRVILDGELFIPATLYGSGWAEQVP